MCCNLLIQFSCYTYCYYCINIHICTHSVRYQIWKSFTEHFRRRRSDYHNCIRSHCWSRHYFWIASNSTYSLWWDNTCSLLHEEFLCLLVEDYDNHTVEAVLAAGQQTASINIATIDDVVVEQAEYFNLMIKDVLTLPKGSVQVMEPNSSLITIVNNDGNLWTGITISVTFYTL